MLDFAKRENAVGLFWAGNEQRLFWHEMVDGVKETREASLSALPQFGSGVTVKPLTYDTIEPSPSLLKVFSHIEDILHNGGLSKEKRYEAIFQLLLAKIFDEHAFETRPDQPLEMQDFSALGVSGENTLRRVTAVVTRAVTYYQNHLPNKIPKKLGVRGDDLLEIMKVLAPVKITASKRDVVQTFYMKFAKDLYKWDMAQYFTPTAISDFVIDVLNPQFGEHVCDPACGSADFLVGAFRYGKRYNPGYADCVWGFDSSDNAVQVAVLNMVLNGDGKTNIKKADSLESISKNEDRYDIVVCNPPFGSRILEKRSKILKKYELGHSWSFVDGKMKKGTVLDKQESGILFIEACIRMCRPDGGRIAIILPNGYLGNRSEKFQTVREWLVRHAKIAAIVSLPRFAFKESGADVSASIVFMERREKPLATIPTSGHPMTYQLIEWLGWDAGDKRKKPTYVRNPNDGSLILENGEPCIHSDYAKVLDDIVNSQAAIEFPWLVYGREHMRKRGDGWSVNTSYMASDEAVSLDPKYYCRKNIEHLEQIRERPHVLLGDLVEFVPEKQSSSGARVVLVPSEDYEYVDISHITNGYYNPVPMKGWELPDRAKHKAEPRDIFFGSIWGSVQKWCVVPDGVNNLMVTNGCFRCHVKTGQERNVTDLLAYMTTESWASQLRALCTGSDGLAEIPASVIGNVLIPLLDDDARSLLAPMVERLMLGRNTIGGELASLVGIGKVKPVSIEKRPSHINLV